MKPKFRFEPNAKIFTVGSCFARNIENRLSELGFDVPTMRIDGTALGMLANNFMNKYTPQTIWQEFDWTNKILLRDGIVRTEDVSPLFLDLGDGRFVDLHLYPLNAVNYDLAFRRREAIFNTFKEAFTSQVVLSPLASLKLGMTRCQTFTPFGVLNTIWQAVSTVSCSNN